MKITQSDLMKFMSGAPEHELNPRLLRGLKLGVDPRKIRGKVWVDAVNAAITRAINIADSDRRWNGVISTPHVECFPSDNHPYVLQKVREWHEKIQQEEKLPPVQLSLGLKAGNTMKEAIVQAAHVKRGL